MSAKIRVYSAKFCVCLYVGAGKSSSFTPAEKALVWYVIVTVFRALHVCIYILHAFYLKIDLSHSVPLIVSVFCYGQWRRNV